MIRASWAAPEGVRAFTTTRGGGVSVPPYFSLNLGAFVGDDAAHVAENRRRALEGLDWSEPLWLKQVHGTTVVRAEDWPEGIPEADGAVTESGRPLAVLTADCLPVAMCDRAGSVVGVFHAGWRGLVSGILERGVQAMRRDPAALMAWVGPGIGAASYQVGAEVRRAFLESDSHHEADFRADGPGHWKFDLAGAAVRRLANAGVDVVADGRDTFADEERFFSHRRQAPSGRMATFICLETRR